MLYPIELLTHFVMKNYHSIDLMNFKIVNKELYDTKYMKFDGKYKKYFEKILSGLVYDKENTKIFPNIDIKESHRMGIISNNYVFLKWCYENRYDEIDFENSFVSAARSGLG